MESKLTPEIMESLMTRGQNNGRSVFIHEYKNWEKDLWSGIHEQSAWVEDGFESKIRMLEDELREAHLRLCAPRSCRGSREGTRGEVELDIRWRYELPFPR